MNVAGDVNPWLSASTHSHPDLAWRIGAHLTLAALPLLAISAHVFEVIPMHLTAGLLVVPLLVAIVIATGFRPVEADPVLLRAAAVGAVATAVYDAIRLDTVYLLGWWGDFIPSIGAWILNTDDPTTGLVPKPGAPETIVGYLWRYIGDGGGIGVWFFVVAAALGLRERGPAITIAAAVTFAVAPVWAGLIATVGFAPRAAELMFPLTNRTLALSLLGHLIFGVVLGTGVARTDGLERLWPWRQVRVWPLDTALDWAQGRTVPAPRGPRALESGRTGPGSLRALPPAGWSAAVGRARPRGACDEEFTNQLPPVLSESTPEITQLLHPQLFAVAPAPESPPLGIPVSPPRLALTTGRRPLERQSLPPAPVSPPRGNPIPAPRRTARGPGHPIDHPFLPPSVPLRLGRPNVSALNVDPTPTQMTTSRPAPPAAAPARPGRGGPPVTPRSGFIPGPIGVPRSPQASPGPIPAPPVPVPVPVLPARSPWARPEVCDTSREVTPATGPGSDTTAARGAAVPIATRADADAGEVSRR